MKKIVILLLLSLNAFATDHSDFFKPFMGCWETLEWNGEPAPANHSTDPRFKRMVMTPFARYITDINGSDVATIQGFIFQKIGPTPIPGTIGPHFDYLAVFLDRGTVTTINDQKFKYHFDDLLKDRVTGVDFTMILDSTWEVLDEKTILVTDSRQIPSGPPALSRETQYKLQKVVCPQE